MKKLLAAMFVALLMVGCGDPDLDDKETLDGIIAGAIDGEKLQKRGQKGEELRYAPNEQTPYTGWAKAMRDNGLVEALSQFKDGKQDGLLMVWYTNGQKHAEWNIKDGKTDGLEMWWYENGQKKQERTCKDGKTDGLETYWYENGQKKSESIYKDGELNGLSTYWYENGQKEWEPNYKDGKLVTAVAWKPNGEKCPVTNVVDGNGVKVWYYEEDGTDWEDNVTRYRYYKGTESFRVTYKDGEKVRD